MGLLNEKTQPIYDYVFNNGHVGMGVIIVYRGNEDVVNGLCTILSRIGCNVMPYEVFDKSITLKLGESMAKSLNMPMDLVVAIKQDGSVKYREIK